MRNFKFLITILFIHSLSANAQSVNGSDPGSGYGCAFVNGTSRIYFSYSGPYAQSPFYSYPRYSNAITDSYVIKNSSFPGGYICGQVNDYNPYKELGAGTTIQCRVGNQDGTLYRYSVNTQSQCNPSVVLPLDEHLPLFIFVFSIGAFFILRRKNHTLIK